MQVKKLFLELPDQICNSPYCQPCNSCNVSSENLVLEQLIIPKLIFFFNLITYLVDVVYILLGEILSWSFMRVKGLTAFSSLQYNDSSSPSKKYVHSTSRFSFTPPEVKRGSINNCNNNDNNNNNIDIALIR